MKMKIKILLIIFVFVIAASLISCGGSSEPTVYENLTELTQKSYNTVKIEVRTNTGGIELNSSYVITDQSVEYSVQRMNAIDEDNISALPEEYMSTYSGKAVVENGVLTVLDGENVTLPSYNELKGAFSFKKENFKNVLEEEGKFTADVISAKDFLGIDTAEIQDMTVTVEYNTEGFKKIQIEYKTALSTVTAVYTFE